MALNGESAVTAAHLTMGNVEPSSFPSDPQSHPFLGPRAFTPGLRVDGCAFPILFTDGLSPTGIAVGTSEVQKVLHKSTPSHATCDVRWDSASSPDPFVYTP